MFLDHLAEIDPGTGTDQSVPQANAPAVPQEVQDKEMFCVRIDLEFAASHAILPAIPR